MLTKNKFIFISIISFIIICLVISSYQTIIPGYICFIIYALIIAIMFFKRIFYNKKIAYIEKKETEEKYNKYKTKDNFKND